MLGWAKMDDGEMSVGPVGDQGQGQIQGASASRVDLRDQPLLPHPAAPGVTFRRDANVGRHVEEDEHLHGAPSPSARARRAPGGRAPGAALREAEPYTVSSVRVVPIQGVPVADQQTGAALQAGLVGEVHPGTLFAPDVAAGRTGERAGAMLAALADLLVQRDMGFRVDPIAHQIEQFVGDHRYPLPASNRSASIRRTGTRPFVARRARRMIRCLGVPSDR